MKHFENVPLENNKNPRNFFEKVLYFSSMSIWENVFLGFFQGFTEFLPVSSSGHLFLAQEFFGYTPNISLEIWLHMASVLAVGVFFWKRILKIFLGFFSLNADGVLGLKLVLSTFVTGVLGIFFQKYFQNILDIRFVGTTLLFTAFFILLSEKFRSRKKQFFSWEIAFFLGIIQAIAVLPGISRSGITIAFLIFLGIERKKSAEISFLVAIPTILGAFFYSLGGNSQEFFTTEIGWGIFTAFIASLISIGWMMKLIQERWVYFAPYCALLGGTLILFF